MDAGRDVHIRGGVHIGEVDLRGDDVGGIAVNICAQISALVGAGQILVTRTVTDLVAGSGIVFDEGGEYELRGVPGNWKAYRSNGTEHRCPRQPTTCRSRDLPTSRLNERDSPTQAAYRGLGWPFRRGGGRP